MNAITQNELADHMETNLNVLPFGPMTPQKELDRLASTHRKAVAKYDQRAADTRKEMKATVAQLEADKKAEIKRHQEEMAALSERIADEKAKADSSIEADKKLAASCRAALAALDMP